MRVKRRRRLSAAQLWRGPLIPALVHHRSKGLLLQLQTGAHTYSDLPMVFHQSVLLFINSPHTCRLYWHWQALRQLQVEPHLMWRFIRPMFDISESGIQTPARGCTTRPKYRELLIPIGLDLAQQKGSK